MRDLTKFVASRQKTTCFVGTKREIQLVARHEVLITDGFALYNASCCSCCTVKHHGFNGFREVSRTGFTKFHQMNYPKGVPEAVLCDAGSHCILLIRPERVEPEGRFADWRLAPLD